MSGYLNSAGIIHSAQPDPEQTFSCSASPPAWLVLLRKPQVEISFFKGIKTCCLHFDFFYYAKKLILWCKKKINSLFQNVLLEAV